MNEATNNLWGLICSLNTQERLFYRRDYNKVSEEKKVPLYLKLFDTLCKAKNYDEDALLKMLAPGISRKNISYLKNYLFEDLSNALIELNSRKDAEAILFKSIQWIRILRKKNLFNQAVKIAEGLIQSGAYNDFVLMQELLHEYRILIWYENSGATYSSLKECLELQRQHNLVSSKEKELQLLYCWSLLLKRKTHFKPNATDLAEIDELFERLIIVSVEESDPFLVHHYHKMCFAVLLYLKGNASSNNYAYDNIAAWHNHYDIIVSQTENYLEALYIYIYTSILAGAYKEMIGVMSHDVTGLIESTIRKSYCQTIRYLGLNRAYNKLGEYDNVRDVLGYMKEHESVWKASIHMELSITLYLSIGVASFVLEQFDDAYYYIKSVSVHFNNQTRKEHLSFAFLFLLIICFEKRDYYLFDTQYNSTYSFFYKKEKPEAFEKAIMQTLKKLINPIYENERMALLEQLLDDLETTKDNPVQQGIFSIFNIPRWLESKIKGMPYRSLVLNYIEQEKQPYQIDK